VRANGLKISHEGLSRSSSLASGLTSRIGGGIASGMTTSIKEDKVTENRLRRAADRQGLRLMKSRSRDPRAMDYGLYALINDRIGGAVNPSLANRWTCSWTLEQVEQYLNEP
jgi:hypothetical protein